ncbi:AHH domain-containing protein [Corallococcus interemptor]|uniref:AHH domain-containing protein n=1 Tax=Corallococcus interemptor TaxID=2316720 RepID=UPI003D0193CC
MSSCLRWVVAVLLLWLGTGCSATRGVRLKTGRGAPVVHVPRAEVAPVELGGDAFQAAVRTLVEEAPGSTRAYAHVRGRLGLVSVGEPARARLLGDDLASAYGRWCQRKQTPGDCLQLLERGPTLDEDGRRSLAFAIALDSVWDETSEALVGMTDQRAVLTTIVATGTMYLALWLLPEPVSKGIAATMTVVLIAYLGVDTVWNLIQGWIELSEQARVARTFDELRDAGEEYGEVMGKNAARAFVMLALAAVGSTAETFAAKVATLPGSGQASLVAAEMGGFRLSAAAQVESAAVSSEGVVTLVLAPNAVAMSAREDKGPVASGADADGPEHHIASNKFWTATNRGGPWSPQFQKIFDKAGMSLDDPANKVRVPGHKGPHPEAYHRKVFAVLDRATAQCRSMQECRTVLTRELRNLARMISEQGTDLNRWVTGIE